MLFIFGYVVVMLDVYFGKGLMIGSVILMKGVIILVVVGVDIGCGMMVVCMMLMVVDLFDLFGGLCSVIECVVLYGCVLGWCDLGVWGDCMLVVVIDVWKLLQLGFQCIVDKYLKLVKMNYYVYFGMFGIGNYFIEVCIDEVDCVWFMLYSGLCGVGNVIGSLFIEFVQVDM